MKLAASRHVYWLLLLPFLIFACAPQKPAPLIWYSFLSFGPAPLQSGIMTLNPATLEQRTLVPLESDTFIQSADLSPDGKHLAYEKVYQDGEETWLANADGSNPIRVTEMFSSTGHLWLTDTRLVVMGVNVGLDPANGEARLYDLAARQAHPLTLKHDPYGCTKSRYDSGLVRVSIVSSSSVPVDDSFAALGHLELDGNVLRAVPDIRLNLSQWPGERGGYCQSWTPDRDKIVFEGSLDKSDVTDLFLATQQGKTVTRLTDWGKDYEEASLGPFAISPDGQWIVLALGFTPRSGNVQSSRKLALLSVDGKTLQFLGDFGTQDQIIWSADSRAAVMSLYRTDNGISNIHREIYILNPETRELKALTSDGAFKQVFAWR